MADIWVDCWEELQATTSAMAEWECALMDGVTHDVVINVLELGDEKTDHMLGWEKYSTLQGLINQGKIPKAETLSETDLLAFFDEVLSREASILHGRPSTHFPYSCALFSTKLEEICGTNEALKAFYKATIAAYGIYNTIIARSASFFEFPDEVGEPHPSVVAILRTVEVAETIAALEKVIATTTNENIKTRLQLRQDILTSLSFNPKQLRKSASAMAAVATMIRQKVLPTLSAPADMSKMGDAFFPVDAKYWDINVMAVSSSVMMPDNTIEFLAKFFESSSEAFTKMDAARSIFDIITVAEYFGSQTPILVRGVVMILLLDAEGNFAGGSNLDVRIINHLTKNIGAPLYEQMIERNPSASNTSLSDVCHYYISGQKNIVKPQEAVMKAFQQQCAQQARQCIGHITQIFELLVSGALRHPARFQRTLAECMTSIGQRITGIVEFEQTLLRTGTPMGSLDITDAQLSEYRIMSSALSAFTTEIALDVMERYIRITGQLDLPATNEYPAMMWYLQRVTMQRQECIYNLHVRAPAGNSTGAAVAIPERRVNKRTNVPLHAPALTTRVPTTVPQDVSLRLQLITLLAEASASANEALCRAGVVRGSDVANYLVSVGNSFDHRFECLMATRTFHCPGYISFERHFDRILAGRTTYDLLTTAANIGDSVAKAAGNAHQEMVRANQTVTADAFQNLRKSGLALNVNLIAIRDQICAEEALVSGPVTDPVQLISPEQLRKNLNGRKIVISSKDFVVAIPSFLPTE